MVSALEYAHDHGLIVHRDLKPSNLMVDSRSRLKITDFGIARSISDSVSRVSVRQPGATSGSPPYMSPQQVLGEPASVSDDIYSLGATLYDLLTGKPPFFSGNIYRQIEDVVPPSMADRRQVLEVANAAAIPEIWEETVAACLAKNPADRPGSAREVWERINGPAVHQPRSRSVAPTPTPRTAVPPRGPSKTVRNFVLAILLIGLVAAGGWYGFRVMVERDVADWALAADAADRAFHEGRWQSAEDLLKQWSERGGETGKGARAQLKNVQSVLSGFSKAEAAVSAGDVDTIRSEAAQLKALGVLPSFLADLEARVENLAISQKNQKAERTMRDAIAGERFDDAIKHADAFLAVDPSNASVMALKREATTAKQKAAVNKEVGALLARAKMALEEKSPAYARTLLSQALDLDPENATATKLLEADESGVRESDSPHPDPVLSTNTILVTTAGGKPMLTFPTGQQIQIPGSTTYFLREPPRESPDGSVVAVTTRRDPEENSSNKFATKLYAQTHLLLSGRDGQYSQPIDLNSKLNRLSVPSVANLEQFVSSEYLAVQRVENDTIFLEAMGSSGMREFIPIALRLIDGQPVFPDGNGTFLMSTVFTGGPYARFNSSSKEQVMRKVQQTLKDRNFYASSVDGAMGRGTQAAIIKFQQTENIAPTGLLDAPTLSAMGMVGLTESQPPLEKPAAN